MLGQRRRRWPNIGPTLGRCLVFCGDILLLVDAQVTVVGGGGGVKNNTTPTATQGVEPMLDYCWSSVADGGHTIIQQSLEVMRLVGRLITVITYHGELRTSYCCHNVGPP